VLSDILDEEEFRELTYTFDVDDYKRLVGQYPRAVDFVEKLMDGVAEETKSPLPRYIKILYVYDIISGTEEDFNGNDATDEDIEELETIFEGLF